MLTLQGKHVASKSSLVLREALRHQSVYPVVAGQLRYLHLPSSNASLPSPSPSPRPNSRVLSGVAKNHRTPKLRRNSFPLLSQSTSIRVGSLPSSFDHHSIDIRTMSTQASEQSMLKKDHADILHAASAAQDKFATMTQEDADRIFTAVARVANKSRVPLATLAAEETKMGCFEDKVLKNGLACELIYDRYKDSKTCGLIGGDDPHGKRMYASPVGPVCAITPVTNPTSTAISKCLMMAKTRNTGVFMPHPRASKCTAEAVRICREAGEAAGAPAGWVQCVQGHTLEDSQAIMKDDNVRLILSTGGPGMVKASYSCGKPAIGVGSGNAPIMVDETADIHMACGSIVLGKTFDNGMICAAEQSVVAVDDIYDELKSLLEQRGVYFLQGEDRDKLAAFLEKDGRINPEIVGQSVQEIIHRAGIEESTVPSNTVVLATEESDVGKDYPLSKEKLSPVLALYKASTFQDGVQTCRSLALNGGVGHTAGLYTSRINQHERVKREEEFLKYVPVHRVLVNAPTSLAAIGSAFNFSIDPSFTLGVGTSAGSSVSANLGPAHLVNVTTLAERQEHIEWFKVPQQIYFNRGCLEEALRGIAAGGEKRAIIVTDKGMVRSGILQRIITCLREEGLVVEVFSDVLPDPNMDCVRKGVEACNSFKPDVMVCLGGGSPIDAGKFIRVQYEHPQVTLEDASARFIEIRKRTCPFPKLGSKIGKLVAIPTTSGTGSEVSPFTVITSDDGTKFPIASYKLTPDVAICDSTLCDSLPKPLVAHAGLDSITHAVEAFVSVAQNDFTKQNALEALDLLFKHLPESYNNGSVRSRDACHRGATLAGIAFSNSFLGICHSLAHQVGAKFHLPHGLTCAILLPRVIAYNACESPTRMGIYPSYEYPQAAERYAVIAKHIGAPTNDADGLIQMIREVMQEVEAPLTFKEAGVNEKDFLESLDDMARQGFDDQCTGANPRFPIVGELKSILTESYYGTIEEGRKYQEQENEHDEDTELSAA